MSSKKRRIESVETPKSAVSAISALAARRKGAAASAASSVTNTPEVEDKPVASNVNYFSPLQKYSGQDASPKSPGKRLSKSSRTTRSLDAPATLLRGTGSPSEQKADPILSSSAATRVTQYSSFRLSKSNHRVKSGGVLELRLAEGERFLVLGSFGLRILHGEVTIAGASLKPSETLHWVHAPHCHAVPVLRTAENTGLELHPDPSSWELRQLGRISPLFRKIWNEIPEGGSKSRRSNRDKTFQILCTSDDAPKRCIIQSLVSPPEWNKKLATLASVAQNNTAFTTVVCGPKSAGKSTFSKLLTNRLLTDQGRGGDHGGGVVILDLDPGQPEYAPSGTVSLVHVTQPNLGPPFAHPGGEAAGNTIIRCHALASVTPASDPDLYLRAAIDLYESYRKSLADLPLIVNTPGWILGTGLDLLSEIVEKLRPEEVIYMSEEGPAETVDVLKAVTKTVFTELPSQQSEFTSRTAAHLRGMQTLSYFHLAPRKIKSTDPPKGVSTLRWNSASLSTKSPLLIRYAGRKPGILGIMSYDYQSPPELLSETINGLVVGIVEIEDARALMGLWDPASHRAFDTEKPKEPETEGGSVLLDLISRTSDDVPFITNLVDAALDPKFSNLIGLALIRGIDKTAKQLQVLTPVSQETIQAVRMKGRDIVLVHGKFDVPAWAYTEDLYGRAGDAEESDIGVEIMEEDTSEDDSAVEPEHTDAVKDVEAIPWVEVLRGNQKRPVGSRVWRVRRDLGRNTGD